MDLEELKRLVSGEKNAWDAFVDGYMGVIYAAVWKTTASYVSSPSEEDICDIVQDVFARLCQDNYRLLRSYDPCRASLATWLTLVARSQSITYLRRRRPKCEPLDDWVTQIPAPDPPTTRVLEIPEGLLSPRQKLVMRLLYTEQMEVAEIAEMLRVSAQTVRSTKHKAIAKLRRHFRSEPAPDYLFRPGDILRLRGV